MYESNYPPGCSSRDPYFNDDTPCEHVYENFAADDPQELEACCLTCGERRYPAPYPSTDEMLRDAGVA